MRRTGPLVGRDLKARVAVESVTPLAFLNAGSLLLQRPPDVLADDGGGVVGTGGESGDDALVGGRIAERDGDVAEPALVARAAQRRARGALLPFPFGPFEEGDQPGAVEAVADGEVADARRSRELVPRAEELAIVAAEDSVADGLAQRLRYRTAQLDREIRDAAAGIELVRSDDRLRGADVEAGAAGPAVVGHGHVRRQRQVGVELAEQEPRSVAIEQIRVLADPPKACIASERLLEHGRAVDEDAIAELPDALRDGIRQALQARAQHLVIVAAERVTGHVARGRIGQGFASVARGVRPVAHARRDDSDRARHELGRPRALAAMPFHVRHRSLASEREPALEPSFVGLEIRFGDSELREAEIAAELLDFACQPLELCSAQVRHGTGLEVAVSIIAPR